MEKRFGSIWEKMSTLRNFLLFGVFGITVILIILISGIFPSFVTQAATTPAIITYQGKLLINGSSATTTLSMKFVLYDDPVAGVARYTASGTLPSTDVVSITPSSGLFSINLGDTVGVGDNPITNAIPTDLFSTYSDLYLEVTINGQVMSPRKRLTASPYAFHSGTAVTSTFAYNAQSSTYAGSAGTSTYADTANLAFTANTSTYANNADTSTYAINAGTSTYANTAGNTDLFGNLSTSSFARLGLNETVTGSWTFTTTTNFQRINANGNLSVLGNTTLATTTISGNLGIGAASPYDTAVHISAEGSEVMDAARAYITSVYHNSAIEQNGAPAVFLALARGTVASPSAVRNGNILGIMGAFGYGTDMWNDSSASIVFKATEDFTNGAAGSSISFYTARNGSDSIGERMVINHDGRVAIGTSTPVSILTVYGDIDLNGDNRYLNFGNTTGTSGYGFRDNGGILQIKNNNGMDWVNIPTSTTGGSSLWTESGSDIYYNSGNVGVGTTTPTSKLTVIGDSSSAITVGNGVSNGSIYVDGMFSALNFGSESGKFILNGVSGSDATSLIMVNPTQENNEVGRGSHILGIGFTEDGTPHSLGDFGLSHGHENAVDDQGGRFDVNLNDGDDGFDASYNIMSLRPNGAVIFNSSSPIITPSSLSNILFNAGGIMSAPDSLGGPAVFWATENASNTGWMLWDHDDDDLEFGTLEGGSYYYQTLVLKTGNVGIGTSTPSTLLTVAGTSTLYNVLPDTTGSTGNVSLYSLGNSTNRWASLWANEINIGTSTWKLYQDQNGDFGVLENGSADPVMFIDASTNFIGINTTSASDVLTVDGSVRIGDLKSDTGIFKSNLSGNTFGSNLFANSSFEGLSSWGEYSMAGIGFPITANVDWTPDAYDGDLAAEFATGDQSVDLWVEEPEILAPTPHVNFAYLYQYEDAIVDNNYRLSFYAKGESEGDTIRVMFMNDMGSMEGLSIYEGDYCADEQEFGVWNFDTESWDCILFQAGPDDPDLVALMASSSPHQKTFSLTTSYESYAQDVVAGITDRLYTFIGVGGDTEFSYQTSTVDLVEFKKEEANLSFVFQNNNNNNLLKIDQMGNLSVGDSTHAGSFSLYGSGVNRSLFSTTAGTLNVGENDLAGGLYVNNASGTYSFSVSPTGTVSVGDSSSTGTLAVFGGAGAISLFVKANGNIGVGTTTPSSKLHIYSNSTGLAAFSRMSGLTSDLFGSPSDDPDAMIAGVSSNYVSSTSAALRAVAYVSTGDWLYDFVSLDRDLNISATDNSGPKRNINIFTTASNDGYGGDIVFSAASGTQSNGSIKLNYASYSNIPGSGNTGLILTGAGRVGVGTTVPTSTFSILAATSTGGILQVGTTTNQNILYVGANGKVGIGTSTPSFVFDVQGGETERYLMRLSKDNSTGEVKLGNNSDTSGVFQPFIIGINDGSSNTPGFSIYGKVDDDTAGYGPVVSIQGVGNDSLATTNRPVFGVSNGYAINLNDYEFIIDADGKVGIGTATPSTTLFVSGTSGGTNDWVNYSDERLKTNISTIDNALAKVLSLRGVYFDWKDPEGHFPGRQVGMIAQETMKIIPELVSDLGGTLGIHYSQLTGLLVEAFKEQQAQIDALTIGLSSSTTSAIQQLTINHNYPTTFTEKITFQNHVNFDEDAIGQVKILAGATSTHVSFVNEYDNLPIISVTPVGLHEVYYGVEKVTVNGFDVALSRALDKDIVLNWFAFSTNKLKMHVSDGTVVDVGIVMMADGTMQLPTSTPTIDTDGGTGASLPTATAAEGESVSSGSGVEGVTTTPETASEESNTSSTENNTVVSTDNDNSPAADTSAPAAEPDQPVPSVTVPETDSSASALLETPPITLEVSPTVTPDLPAAI